MKWKLRKKWIIKLVLKQQYNDSLAEGRLGGAREYKKSKE
jgi:hypothetical protein